MYLRRGVSHDFHVRERQRPVTSRFCLTESGFMLGYCLVLPAGSSGRSLTSGRVATTSRVRSAAQRSGDPDLFVPRLMFEPSAPDPGVRSHSLSIAPLRTRLGTDR